MVSKLFRHLPLVLIFFYSYNENMKYILPVIFAFFLLLCVGILPAHAAVATQSGTTNVTAIVAGNSLSLSGYIAPFASIVLTINGNVITSTVADAQGNFAFSNVAVPKATTTVCLNAVDFKKLGESEACISVKPIDGVISRTGIFLPPTLGVQRTDVFVGNAAIAFGYGMPGAIITVHINNTVGCSVTADPTGYYTCNITIQKAGDNILYADAVLQGKPSEAQLKKILIKGITAEKASPTPTLSPAFVPSFPGLFAIPWWAWLLLILIVIILIIILTRKYWYPYVPAVGVPMANLPHAFDFLFKSKKLHHWWMEGVGY